MNTKDHEHVITKDLRDNLKAIIQKEIKQLPQNLDTLTTKERLNILCKLIPYVFPKISSVQSNAGEPSDFDW